jgi:hypothetical protein
MDDDRWTKLFKIRGDLYKFASNPEKLGDHPNIVSHFKQITGLRESDLYEKISKNCLVCGYKYTVGRAFDIGICDFCNSYSNLCHEAGHASYLISSGLEVDYVSCLIGKTKTMLNEKDIKRLINSNNFQPLLNAFLAGPIAQSIFLGEDDWLEKNKLLDKYLTKFVKNFFSKKSSNDLLYGSFSNIIYNILLSGYTDILYYVFFISRHNPKFKNALLHKKIDKNLIQRLKSDIKKVKKELLEQENWRLVCKISDELFNKKRLEGDQIKKVINKYK